jgi:hypothetical protein
LLDLFHLSQGIRWSGHAVSVTVGCFWVYTGFSCILPHFAVQRNERGAKPRFFPSLAILSLLASTRSNDCLSVVYSGPPHPTKQRARLSTAPYCFTNGWYGECSLPYDTFGVNRLTMRSSPLPRGQECHLESIPLPRMARNPVQKCAGVSPIVPRKAKPQSLLKSPKCWLDERCEAERRMPYST